MLGDGVLHDLPVVGSVLFLRVPVRQRERPPYTRRADPPPLPRGITIFVYNSGVYTSINPYMDLISPKQIA